MLRRFINGAWTIALALTLAGVASAQPIDRGVWGEIYFSLYRGTPNLHKVPFCYDGAGNLVYGEIEPVGQVPFANGLAWAPDGDLLVGGLWDAVYKVDPATGAFETANAGGAQAAHLEVDPDGTRVWTSGQPGGWLAEIPLAPFGDGTAHAISGDDSAVTHVVRVGATAFYTSSGPYGWGSFGIIDLSTFVTTRLHANLPAAHGMTFDPFTGHLLLFGESTITQIDPATGQIVADQSFASIGQMVLDHGVVDGQGHLFVCNNNGRVLFIDYAQSGRIDDPSNFIDHDPHLIQFMDDVAVRIFPGPAPCFEGGAEGIPIAVPVDIKPGSCPNPLDLKKGGTVPVALLGTADFDVATVDWSTLRLEGIEPSRIELEDVGTPYEGDLLSGDCEGCHTLLGDGRLDLILHFDAQELIGELELVVLEGCVPLLLEGNLLPELGGAAFEDTHIVRMQLRGRR